MNPKIKELAKMGFRGVGLRMRKKLITPQDRFPTIPLEDQETMVKKQREAFKAITGRDYDVEAEVRYPVDNEYEKKKPFSDPQGQSGDLLIAMGTMIKLLHLPIGAAVLDLGCGCGWTSILLARCGFQVTGVDVNGASLAIGKRNAEAAGVSVNFTAADIQQFTVDQRFDAVVIFDALHHCLRERSVLARAEWMLRPGGKILLSEQDYPDEDSAGVLTHDAAAKTMQRFGTLEKGLGTMYLARALLDCGFEKITVFSSNCHYHKWHLGRKPHPGERIDCRLILTSDFAEVLRTYG